MELFERFDELAQHIDRMNHEAVQNYDIPYIRLHDFTHYMDLKVFFNAYTRRLRLPKEQSDALFSFIYEDTQTIKQEHPKADLYLCTFAYFKHMVYRTGNLDTPDDCVEKLDLDLFEPYRAARQKQLKNEALSDEERLLITRFHAQILKDAQS